jgi:hypothetical protein
VLRKAFLAVLPVAMLAALLLATAAGSTPAQRAVLDAATFSDAAGDSGAAPDIGDVAVGNDVVAGQIVFWVAVRNRPDDLTGEDSLFVTLDTDRNPATGDEVGAEYWIYVDSEGSGLAKWDGSTHVGVESPTLRADFFKDAEVFRILIHPSDLEGISAFDFNLLATDGATDDWAPNGPPSWSYTLASGKPPLVLLDFVLSPKRPVAGNVFLATILVGRGDTFDLLGSRGKVTCTLLVGGKPLRAARMAFSQGLPVCRWILPRTAKGKLLKGSIAVTYAGSTAKKTFSVRAR